MEAGANKATPPYFSRPCSNPWQKAGAETELVELAGSEIRGCMGCYSCFLEKRLMCPKEDILNSTPLAFLAHTAALHLEQPLLCSAYALL